MVLITSREFYGHMKELESNRRIRLMTSKKQLNLHERVFLRGYLNI